MALEDYTTYAETDSHGDLVVAANLITVTTMTRAANAYVIKSFGANHFGDLEHLVSCQATQWSNDSPTKRLGIWSISDSYYTENDMSVNDEGISVFFYMGTWTVHRIILFDFTNDNQDSWISVIKGTPYYLTIERAGTTMTVDIYDDAARTNWKDTITVTCTSATYEYMNACHSLDQTGTNYITGLVWDLDLQEAGPADVSAGIKLWDGTADIELVKDDTSPVKIRTPTATIGVKVVATGDANASAIRVRVGATTKAFKKKV